MPRPHLTSFFVLAAALATTSARADEAAASDVDVVQQLRMEAPDQVAPFLQAERLSTSNPERSIALYAEVGRRTSAFSEAHRRACLLALTASTRDHAQRLCVEATQRLRSPANLTALALVFATRVGVFPLDSVRARELCVEALADPDADTLTAASVCRVEAALDPSEGEACARRLPNDAIAARTLAFSGVLEAATKIGGHTALSARVAEELTSLAPDDEFGWTQLATLAANRRDAPTVRRAAAQLRRLSRRGPEAPYFESLAHEIEGRDDAAARTLAEAEHAGLAPAELERTRTRRAQRAHAAWLVHGPKWALAAALGSWLVLVAGTWGMARRLSRRLCAELDGGAPLPREDDLSPGKERRRSLYGAALRFLAVLCSQLWWTLVSWVVVLTLWQPWRLWRTSSPIAHDAWMVHVIMLCGLIGTIWREARPKPGPPPGLRLPLDEHPVLASVLAEVAEAVSGPPITDVYLTRGNELCVTTRGTLIADLRGTTRPCLIVGAELLQSIDIQAFRALLAQRHALVAGDQIPAARFALAVRARHRAGRRRWTPEASWNPARYAKALADRAFHDVSQAAVRFQDLRGDRLAVAAYGYEAFERGLGAITREAPPAKDAPSSARPIEDPYRDEPRQRAPEELADRLARVERTPRREGSEDFDEDASRRAWLLLSNRRELKKQLEAYLALPKR